jgi:tight adherence protein B
MKQAVDYRSYELNFRQKALSVALLAAALFAAGYLFFRHPLWASFCVPPSLAAPKWLAGVLQRRRQEQLTLQFQQLLHSLSSSLNAGRSLEGALADAARDMIALYPEPRAMIHLELRRIAQKLDNGIPVDQAMDDFGQRSGIEDVRHFAEVLAICKRQGGNAAEVARQAAHLIHEKLDMQRSIQAMTAQKRWEARMLAVSPFAIVAFLSAASADYMAPLFTGGGRLIMLAALLVLCGCIRMCIKMAEIRV